MTVQERIVAIGEEPLIAPSAAIVLPGGRVALIVERSSVSLPARGTVEGAGAWVALSQEVEGLQLAVALLPAMPPHGARLLDLAGEPVARIARAGHLDVTAAPLLRLVRAAPERSAELLRFLQGAVGSVAPGLVAEFVQGAAEQAGFVEVAARTECGGLYLQGWAQGLEPGFVAIQGLPGSEGREMAVASFARDDILAPAAGICLYARLVPPELPVPPALYFERGGRIARLDVIAATRAATEGAAATVHIRAMLPRLEAPRETLGAFRRICRPRFEGRDTLAEHAGPVDAAFDRVWRAADGTLLVSGWLLDPLGRVEHALLKSRANLYAPLHRSWHLLPRPDLNKAFASNPRFAGLIDDRDVMHGFITHVPARPDQTLSDVYLELVLDDGSCLFRPVTVTPCQGEAVLPAILVGLSPAEPELPQIVEQHLAPFLQGLAREAKPLKRIARPSPLGPGPAGHSVAAVMPVASLAELQPIFAALVDSPGDAAMDLTLVAGRRVAAEIRDALDASFRFYGLTGQLVVVPDHATLQARLDAGLDAVEAARVLFWQPCALPRDRGWLARLVLEADRTKAGQISPALMYEDGSIYFAAMRPDLAGANATCSQAGFGSDMLDRGLTRPVSAAAAEISLVNRERVVAAGGMSGHLFSDRFTHLDLARRLRGAGAGIWCAPAIGFWMVEDPRPEDDGPHVRMTRAIDAALIARRLATEAAPTDEETDR